MMSNGMLTEFEDERKQQTNSYYQGPEFSFIRDHMINFEMTIGTNKKEIPLGFNNKIFDVPNFFDE